MTFTPSHTTLTWHTTFTISTPSHTRPSHMAHYLHNLHLFYPHTHSTTFTISSPSHTILTIPTHSTPTLTPPPHKLHPPPYSHTIHPMGRPTSDQTEEASRRSGPLLQRLQTKVRELQKASDCQETSEFRELCVCLSRDYCLMKTSVEFSFSCFFHPTGKGKLLFCISRIVFC